METPIQPLETLPMKPMCWGILSCNAFYQGLRSLRRGSTWTRTGKPLNTRQWSWWGPDGCRGWYLPPAKERLKSPGMTMSLSVTWASERGRRLQAGTKLITSETRPRCGPVWKRIGGWETAWSYQTRWRTLHFSQVWLLYVEEELHWLCQLGSSTGKPAILLVTK